MKPRIDSVWVHLVGPDTPFVALWRGQETHFFDATPASLKRLVTALDNLGDDTGRYIGQPKGWRWHRITTNERGEQ